MSASTASLQRIGQSLWLDNISRGLLDDGTLARLIRDLHVTGLTSNPSIFNLAVKDTPFYDRSLAALGGRKLGAEEAFFEIAIEDLQRAADLFRPVYDRTGGIDGWVSLEVSPKHAYDTAATIAQVKALHARAARPNLFIKIPGTPEGLPAIQEAIFAGVPVNVTLLFTREQYLAAAEAYLRGIERRVEAGLSPRVCSVASLFISRWDGATAKSLPPDLANRLGIAVGETAYQAYRELLASDRFERLCSFGAVPQRLLFASTGVKDPALSPCLYVEALAAPNSINTIPEKTLYAFAEQGRVAGTLSAGGGLGESIIAAAERAGVNVAALGSKLQRDGAELFVKSWDELLGVVEAKSRAMTGTGA